MLRENFVFCDLCLTPMGQLWNLPVCSPDALPAPHFHVCDDCWLASEPACQSVKPDGERHV